MAAQEALVRQGRAHKGQLGACADVGDDLWREGSSKAHGGLTRCMLGCVAYQHAHAAKHTRSTAAHSAWLRSSLRAAYSGLRTTARHANKHNTSMPLLIYTCDVRAWVCTWVDRLQAGNA
jgi:hypothetical protein